MQRICVIGCSGAGKSTLAKRLSHITDLPLISLDAHYWQAGWKPTPTDQWHALHQTLIDRECWIIDGNYNSTLEPRMAAADTIIFLDYPRYRCLLRVLRRTMRGWGQARSELAPGCPERFDWEFLLYVWNFQHRHRPRLFEVLQRYGPERRVHVIANDRDSTALLAQFESSTEPGRC